MVAEPGERRAGVRSESSLTRSPWSRIAIPAGHLEPRSSPRRPARRDGGSGNSRSQRSGRPRRARPRSSARHAIRASLGRRGPAGSRAAPTGEAGREGGGARARHSAEAAPRARTTGPRPASASTSRAPTATVDAIRPSARRGRGWRPVRPERLPELEPLVEDDRRRNPSARLSIAPEETIRSRGAPRGGSASQRRRSSASRWQWGQFGCQNTTSVSRPR